MDAWSEGNCNITSTEELELARVLNKTASMGELQFILATLDAIPVCAELQEEVAVRALAGAVGSMADFITNATTAEAAAEIVRSAEKVALVTQGSLSPPVLAQLTPTVQAALRLPSLEVSDLSPTSLAAAVLGAIGAIRQGMDVTDNTTATAAIGAELQSMASALGLRIAGSLPVNETADLRTSSLEVSLVSAPVLGGSVSDIQVGEVFLDEGELDTGSAPAANVRLLAASPDQGEGCQSIAVQQTAWRGSNPYFWARQGDLQVQPDANVTAVDVWLCGQRATFRDPAPSCRILFPRPSLESEVACVRLDEGNGSWTEEGVTTEVPSDSDAVACISSRCAGAFALALKPTAVPSLMPSAGEDTTSAASSAQTFIISASILVGGVLSSLACYAACWGRRPVGDAEEASLALPSLLPVCPTKEIGLPSGSSRERISPRSSPEEVETPRSLGHIAVVVEGEECEKRPTDRDTLIRAVFERLDANGSGSLAAEELRKLANLVGFCGDESAWASDYAELCAYLGCSASAGIDLLSFATLVDDDSAQGCFCSDEELRSILELRDDPLSPSSGVCSRPELPEPSMDSSPCSNPVSIDSGLGLLVERGVRAQSSCSLGRGTPKFGSRAGSRASSGVGGAGELVAGEVHARQLLITDVFLRLDADGDAHLSALELRPLADFVGFEGPAEQWAEEFKPLCRYLGCDSGQGLDLQAFSSLVNDSTKDGCFCSDPDLFRLLANLKDGDDPCQLVEGTEDLPQDDDYDGLPELYKL